MQMKICKLRSQLKSITTKLKKKKNIDRKKCSNHKTKTTSKSMIFYFTHFPQGLPVILKAKEISLSMYHY